MRIIAKRSLREFWVRHPDAELALRAWHQDVQRAHWKRPEDLRAIYAHCSIVANHRAVFNIRGNRYRLITAINYEFAVVYIRFIGTHRDYDRVDATKI